MVDKIKYPEVLTDGRAELVYKDGKKYFKTAHYKLSYYTYEEVKEPQKIDLPEKLPDIKRNN